MATLSCVFVWGDAFRFSIVSGQFDSKAVFLCSAVVVIEQLEESCGWPAGM